MMAMNTKTATRGVWQLPGGHATRPYADVFLKYGFGLIGPGEAGSWKPERDDDQFEGGFVRPFASEVQVGGVFLLRTGMLRICAVGIVSSDYLYLNECDDVSGWDLQHARGLRWYKLPQEHAFTTPVCGAHRPCFSRVLNN